MLPDLDTVAALNKGTKGLSRALGVPIDGGEVVARLVAACHHAVLDGLSIAQAAGVLVPGQERVARAVESGRADMVVLTSDLADRTQRTVRAIAESHGACVVTLEVPADKIGARLGRGPTGVLGVGPSRPARHLRRWLRRLSALG